MRSVSVGVVLCAAISMSFAGENPPPAEGALKAPPANTTLSAVLNVPHKKGENLIWCNTFQLCWNAMSQDIVGEKIRLEGTPPIENALNEASASKEDLDAESYYLKAGKITPAFLDEISTTLKQRFGANAPTPPQSAKEGFLAYAFLNKKLAFPTPFNKLKHALGWNNATENRVPVQGFGLMHVGTKVDLELEKQVSILVDAPNEYIVELKTTSRQDRLILAQVEPDATLEGTLKKVTNRITKNGHQPFNIQYSDKIEIPNIQFDLDHQYKELLKLKFLNENMEEYSVFEAWQSVRFDLNEKGVELKSEAAFSAAKNGHRPRNIVFNNRFLLLLQRSEAKHPYFVAWFENPNLFVKSDLPIENKPQYKK